MKRTTFIIIAGSFLLTALLAVGGRLWYVRARARRWKRICVENLRLIDGAKEQWATACCQNVYACGPPKTNDLARYLPHNAMPRCPAGGTCIVNHLDGDPLCTIHGGLGRPGPELMAKLQQIWAQLEPRDVQATTLGPRGLSLDGPPSTDLSALADSQVRKLSLPVEMAVANANVLRRLPMLDDLTLRGPATPPQTGTPEIPKTYGSPGSCPTKDSKQ